MKNEKDMIKWLNNLKSDIGQPQHSQLWHYAEILDVIAKYLESTDTAGEWIDRGDYAVCSRCAGTSWQQMNGVEYIPFKSKYCPYCGAKMNKGGDDNE